MQWLKNCGKVSGALMRESGAQTACRWGWDTDFCSSVAYNTEVDINVNTAYPWATTGDPYAYDFQNCFTHELGHLLGLNDENSKSDSTMYSITALGETKKRTLAQDDKNGIGVIY